MRISIKNLIGLSVLASLALMQPGFAEGDSEKGKKVFAKCMACHTIEEAKNRVGPHLVNILDRKTASIEDYKYSPAMTKAGEDGMIWDEATLTAYLTAPKGFMPGNKMAFAGLKKQEDIDNLLAYIRSKATQ